MRAAKFALSGLLALYLGVPLPAGAQPPAGTTSMIPPKDAPPPVAAAPGPYPVTAEAAPGLATHTVIRPTDLSRFRGDKRLPIVAWGNGACSNAGLAFEKFLSTIASNGYMIVVSGRKDVPLPAFATDRAASPVAAAAPPAAAERTSDADMKTGIDWAVAENERKGSPYFHRLDPGKVAVMGQSCGGLQAIANSGDPRVKTTVVWNSGVYRAGYKGISVTGATKASLAAVHAPIAYINGGPADAAYLNALDDVKQLEKVPVFFGWINVGHGGTYYNPGGGRFAKVAVAWLDWRLKGDRSAGAMFQGKDCGLCKDPVWHIERKNMN